MYGEIMIVVNLMFNYAVLTFANAAGRTRISRKRLLLASLAGSLPAAVWPGSWAASCIALFAMVGAAFGFSRKRMAGGAGYVLMGALLAGGLLTALPVGEWGRGGQFRLVLCAGLAFAVLQLVKGKWLSVRQLSRLSEFRCASRLELFGSHIHLDVFIDTGNSCTEPLSGEAVHFVSLKAVKSIIPDELLACLQKTDPSGIPNLKGFPEEFRSSLRLIRIQTVDGAGWAVGIRFGVWELEGNRPLDPGCIVLTADDARYPHQASAILHVSALETTEERGMAHAT